MGRPADCCTGTVALVRYDADNGDILYQRPGSPDAFGPTWDGTSRLLWYVDGGGTIRARSIGGSLILLVESLEAVTGLSVLADGAGVVAWARTAGGGSHGLYHVDADGALVGLYGTFTGLSGFALAMSNGDIVYGSPMTRRDVSDSLIWTADSGGDPLCLGAGDQIATITGRVVDPSDGTHFGNLTGGGAFQGTGSAIGGWGGVTPGVPLTNVLMADVDANPVWDIDVDNDGEPYGCTDGESVYVSTYDFGTIPIRSIVRKYDGTGSLLWEQVGPANQISHETNGMAIDGDGHLVVATWEGSRILQSEWIN